MGEVPYEDISIGIAKPYVEVDVSRNIMRVNEKQ